MRQYCRDICEACGKQIKFIDERRMCVCGAIVHKFCLDTCKCGIRGCHKCLRQISGMSWICGECYEEIEIKASELTEPTGCEDCDARQAEKSDRTDLCKVCEFDYLEWLYSNVADPARN